MMIGPSGSGTVARPSGLLLALVAALLVGQVAGAQERDEPSTSEVTFGEEVDVRVVNVEVVVEDGDGNRVGGLSTDDFEVLVDGEQVDVSYFTEVADGRALLTGDGAAPSAAGGGEVVATNYVIFVDDERTLSAARRLVLRGLAERLDALRPPDRVAVVVQSGGSLELLSPFTTDRAETALALEELDGGERFPGVLGARRVRRTVAGGRGPAGTASYFSGAGPLRIDSGAVADLRTLGGGVRPYYPSGSGDGAHGGMVDSRTIVSESLGAAGAVFASGLTLESMKPDVFVQEARAEALERDLKLSVDAVVSAMRALEPPEGRKVLLLMPGYWPTGEFRPYGRSAGLRTDLELLDDLIDVANLLGYTIYPMDQQDSVRNASLWQNLRHVARDTGGRAFMAGSNISALESVISDTANYYWLGFVSESGRDGRVHDIEVTTLRPGLAVRARRGYLDLSREAEADMEAQGALLFPEQEEHAATRLLAVVGAPRALDRRTMAVPIDIEVSLGMFAALPYGNEYVQRLEVRFATIDREGWRAEQPAIPLEIRRRSAPEPDTVFDYYAEVTMRRLPHAVVVTVHDPVSRATATARVEVEVVP